MRKKIWEPFLTLRANRKFAKLRTIKTTFLFAFKLNKNLHLNYSPNILFCICSTPLLIFVIILLVSVRETIYFNLKNWISTLNKKHFLFETGSRNLRFLKVPHLPTAWKKHNLKQNFHIFAKLDHTFSSCICYEEVHLKHPVFLASLSNPIIQQWLHSFHGSFLRVFLVANISILMKFHQLFGWNTIWSNWINLFQTRIVNFLYNLC